MAAGRQDYLDFDWDPKSSALSSHDDLTDIKNKYDDFLRQEKASMGLGSGGQSFTWINKNRNKSRQNDMYDFYDEFEDEFEEEDWPPKKKLEQEKRYLNGKHILTNEEIKWVQAAAWARCTVGL